MLLYQKNKSGCLADNCNRFIYEVVVTVNLEGFFSTPLIKYFSSDRFLKVVTPIKLSKFTQIETELYSAPLKWLEENDYTLYVKPIKKKRTNVKKTEIVK